MEYTSQFGQDKWIIEEVFKGMEHGFFVDVGAYHPKLINNTYILEKQYKWDGISIDAINIKRMWKKERKTLFIQACIADCAGKKVEFVLSGWDSGIKDYLDNNSPVKKVKQFRTKLLGHILRESKAPNIIHYLDMDIEGAELLILKSFPFDEFTPIALTVEHNEQKSGKNKEKVRDLLFDRGYLCVKKFEIEDGFVLKKYLDNPTLYIS